MKHVASALCLRNTASLLVSVALLALSGCDNANEIWPASNSGGAVTSTGATLDHLSLYPASGILSNGDSLQLSTLATYTDGTVKDVTQQVTWSTSQPNIASFSGAGLLQSGSDGIASITATLAHAAVSGDMKVTSAVLSSIQVTPSQSSFARTLNRQFVATGIYSDGTNFDVTQMSSWSSANSALASASNATATKGIVTMVAAGSTSVIAAFKAQTASAPVTITNASLVSAQIQSASFSLPRGTTQQFTLIGLYSDNSTQDLTSQAAWVSAVPANLSVNKNGVNGLVSADGLGISQISATVGSVTARANATAVNAAVSSLSIDPQNITLAKGVVRNYSVTGLFTDGSSVDLTTQSAWSSDDSTIAFVANSAGVKGNVSAVAVGVTTIYASYGGRVAQTLVSVNSATLSSIQITPSSLTLARGFTQQYAATGVYSDGSSADITQLVNWASSNTAFASVSNGSGSQGIVTAIAVGTLSITATSGSVSATAALTISSATLSSIQISPGTVSLAKGRSQQLTATGVYSDGTNADVTSSVTWSSAAAGIATVSNAAATKGLLTISGIGTTTVTAALGAVQGQRSVTGTSATISSLSLSPGSATIAAGNTQAFTVTGSYSDGTSQDLTNSANWSSSGIAIATVSNGATRGLATGVAQGSVSITATSGSFTANATLTVTAAALSSIEIQPGTYTLPNGTSSSFAAIGHYSDQTSSDITQLVTWTTVSAGIATVSNNAGTHGLVTGISVGTTTLRAALNGQQGSAAITVSSAALSSIGVSPTTPSMAKGSTIQFSATGTYSDGSTQDLTSSVTWASSDTAIATLGNAAGTKGLAAGVTQGSVTVSATLGAKSGSTTLTVTAATLVSIQFSPASPNIPKGTNQQVTATGVYSDGTTADVSNSASWISSNTSVATVNNTAPNRGVVTGVGVGTSVITVTLNGVSSQFTVTITAATLNSLQLNPNPVSLAKGAAQAVTATGSYSDGSTLDLTSAVSWASSNTAIFTVSANNPKGVVTGVAVGSATLTASLNGASASAPVTVSSATVSSLDVQPSTLTLPKGQTYGLTATATYSDGSSADVSSQVTWSSSNTARATVSNAAGSKGLLSGVATGTAVITASLGGSQATMTVTVTSAALSSISVSPASVTLANGLTQQFSASGNYSDGTTADITGSVTWASSNTSVLTLSNANGSKGLGTTASQGNAQVTATLGSSSGNAQVTVSSAALSSIQLSPANPSVAKGVTQPFTASGIYSDGSVVDLTESCTWASTDATIGSVSNVAGSRGRALAKAVGSVTITATSGGVSATTSFTVTSATLSSIQVTPATLSLAMGLNQQFAATGSYSDGSTADITSAVTWSSSSTGVATISNSAGTKGFGAAKAMGNATITATLAAVSGTANFTVTSATLSSIQLSPSSLGIPVGLGSQVTATGIYSDNTSVDITNAATWASAASTIATVSNGSGSRGLVTGVAVGSTTVTVSYSGMQAQLNATVSAATLAALTISGGNSVAKGNTTQLTASATYTDGSTQDVTTSASWTSSDSTLLSISSVAPTKGLGSGVHSGSVTVNATLSGMSATYGVTVTAAVISSIAVTPSSASIAKGLTQQLTATGTFSDGSTADITANATWSSANSAYAAMSNAAGSVGLASGMWQGSTTVTATMGGRSASASITVTAASLVSISISNAGTSIAKGLTRQLAAIGTYSDASTADITSSVVWSSSANAVATVSNATKGLVNSLTMGSTTVTAASGSVSGSATVTVSAPTLVSITVTPGSSTTVIAAVRQLTAIGTYTDGSTADVTTIADWSSSNSLSASVNNTTNKGLVLSLLLSTANIYATIGGVSGVASFTGSLH